MLDRYLSPFRAFGPLSGLAYVLDRALALISPSCRLFLYDLMVQPIPDAPLAPRRSALTLREMRRDDAEVALMPARPDIKEARFQQDAICLGAFRGNRFIGHIWFRFGAYEEDEVRCRYRFAPEGEAVFDFDLYIVPEYRMGRSFAQLWDEASGYLRGRGIRYTYSRVTRFNLASRRAHQRLHSTRVGRALFLTAGRAQLMVASVFPYVHLSFSSVNRPELRLRPDAWLQRQARPPCPSAYGKTAGTRTDGSTLTS